MDSQNYTRGKTETSERKKISSVFDSKVAVVANVLITHCCVVISGHGVNILEGRL